MDGPHRTLKAQGERMERRMNTAAEWSIHVTLVNQEKVHSEWDALAQDPLIQVRYLRKLPWNPPWDWYPSSLVHWGLSADESRPRLWFAGVPQGQEQRVFETLVAAIGRRRRLLSPLTEENLRTIQSPVHLAILTTPG